MVGFVILYFVYQRQEKLYHAKCAIDGIAQADCSLMEKIWTDFTSANFFILLVVIIAFMISNASRAIRWQMMLKSMGFKTKFPNAIGAIMAAYLTNLGVPRSGEIVRAGIISKYEHIPLEKAIGTVVLDRIVDVISLLIVIFLAFVLSFDHMSGYFEKNFNLMTNIQQLVYNPVFIASLMILGLIVAGGFYVYRERIFNSSLGKKVANILKGFMDGIYSIFKLEKPWWFLFHSVIIWLMYFLMTYFCFFAYEPTSHLGPIAGLVVFVFGSLGVVFPAPGGMGSYQFLVGESLGFFNVNAADAFSFSNIVFFAVQLFCNILFGILAFILLPIYNKDEK